MYPMISYTMAEMIHEQRLREAEVDRLAAAIRSAQRVLRIASRRVERPARPQPRTRPAARPAA